VGAAVAAVGPAVAADQVAPVQIEASLYQPQMVLPRPTKTTPSLAWTTTALPL